jgi:FHS family L-fucose permease-like MFS transporter
MVAIWTLVPRGLIMSACVGGAVIPYLLGALTDRVGIQHAFIPRHPLLLHRVLRHVGLKARAPPVL